MPIGCSVRARRWMLPEFQRVARVVPSGSLRVMMFHVFSFCRIEAYQLL